MSHFTEKQIMKFIVFLFIALLFYTELNAQYSGSIGRGDVQSLKSDQGLNGENVSVVYYGGNGRGDNQLLKNGQGLNGEDVNVLYNGGNGRGDVQLLKNAQGLNGEDVNVLYNGGSGRGDIQLIKNAQGLNGEDVNVLYSGGNGRGDIPLLLSSHGLNGEVIGIVYYGGIGRGDVLSEVTSGFADCDVVFFWNGIVSDTWENPANWNCNVLPNINSNVIISSGLSHYPTVNSSTEIKRLECKPGTSVIINPGVILKVNGQ